MFNPNYFQPPMGPPKRTPRQQALTEWRHIDLKPLEDIQSKSTKTITDLVPKVLTEQFRIEHRQSEAEIAKVWSHLIDPNIVAHAKPTGLHNGTLFVSVDNHVWLDEIIRYRRKDILDRLQTSFGKSVITRISFRVG